MAQWWKQNSHVGMGGYQKSQVEDLTGCIPLLLDKCVVGEKIDLTVADLRDIYNKAVGFVRKVRLSTMGDPEKWGLYVRSIRRSGHY